MSAERDEQRDGWPVGPAARRPDGQIGRDGRTGARAAGRPPKSSRPLLTVPQLARESGLPASVLYRWFSLGELAGAVRLGGRIYVRRKVWEAWLAGAGEAAPTAGAPATPDADDPEGDDGRRRLRPWPM